MTETAFDTSTVTYTITIAGTDIPLESGSLDFNAASAPFIRGSVQLPAGIVIDPREYPPPRCQIRVQQTTTVAETITLDLAVRGRDTSQVSGLTLVEVASDEALLEDFAPLTPDATCRRYTSLRDVVRYVLNRVIPGAQLLPGTNPPAVSEGADPEALVWEDGVSALQFLAPIVQAAGCRLVCDETRRWTLRPESFALEGGQSVVLIAPGVNMIEANDTISRDNDLWFDAAVVRYIWTDHNGARREARDSYAIRSAYTRLRTFDREARYPGPGFAKYAVRRSQVRGREVTAEAPALWSVRPEMFAQINTPGSGVQMGNVQRVRFSFDRDDMAVTAQTIDTPRSAYILAPPSTRYIDFPPDMQIQNIDWSLV